MKGPYSGDCCPVCGSYQVTPYAVITGARETYGYHCSICQITWQVLSWPPTPAAAVPGQDPAE
jgi:formate dehydrogenase maturation protein FdhE